MWWDHSVSVNYAHKHKGDKHCQLPSTSNQLSE
jgi:hypothetical protein